MKDPNIIARQKALAEIRAARPTTTTTEYQKFRRMGLSTLTLYRRLQRIVPQADAK